MIYTKRINDIIESDIFNKLKECRHHGKVSRYHHSVLVGYFSYKIAMFLKCDVEEATIVGLLHDLFFYDWHVEHNSIENAYYHPILAAKNAQKYFHINNKEINAIRSHMFPMGTLPSSKIAWILVLSDKISTILEYIAPKKANIMAKNILNTFESQPIFL